MKANELRLGNYLQLDGENYHVNEIYNNLQCVELKRKNLENPKLNDYEECDLDCNDLLPIPLTEEWLLNLGFNSEYKKGWIGIDVKHENGTTTDFVLSYPQRMGMWQTFFAFEYDSFRFVELKYVHQLQNLYFALTGSELVFSTEP